MRLGFGLLSRAKLRVLSVYSRGLSVDLSGLGAGLLLSLVSVHVGLLLLGWAIGLVGLVTLREVNEVLLFDKDFSDGLVIRIDRNLWKLGCASYRRIWSFICFCHCYWILYDLLLIFHLNIVLRLDHPLSHLTLFFPAHVDTSSSTIDLTGSLLMRDGLRVGCLGGSRGFFRGLPLGRRTGTASV